ncbi:ABC transporter substrate-binding protein [Thiosulfativibrio zosterae]|uniref:ABC transporter substrate-binding protein n=1 Tax=Thiosulfativibrio zosterae TaxID=2675053 RepID=A0A6F8PND6_9GAMM|nr:ABC transporter substrate-binding protein [Thiosulfativibrio zosterae]BBP43554.1 ABC transporter substrate-binding protein [Thiosulfativibrio zosterae]
MFLKKLALIGIFLSLPGCSEQPWNNPYAENTVQQPILFSSFSAPPKHLDTVISYSSNEWGISSQIVEPLLQYHYFKQPYTLEPLTLQAMPEQVYLNNDEVQVSANSNDIVFTEYRFKLKDNIQFQPHPAFVKTADNDYPLHHLSEKALQNIVNMTDFSEVASRPLRASDYVYAIKRMGYAKNHSPILGSMQEYIVGLKAFTENLKDLPKDKIDLRSLEISGVKVINDFEFTIRIHGQYPQFIYWLSMNFFAPVPWEAIAFYNQPGLVKKNITYDTYPVGTGPYMLVENNPNKRMRLLANPNYHHGFYPTEGLAEKADAALLKDAGKPLPFIKELIYSLEKESVPLWNKFMQGYYDASGVSSDNFDQAVSIGGNGSMNLTAEMQDRDIQFLNTIEPSIFYFGFNMADEVVGGYSEKQRKLRQALSLAINYEEYISIFLNGRGVAAQGPIPPGIWGFQEGEKGVNPILYDWKNGQAQRKSITEAKRLLAEAGYPNGKKPDGTKLTLHYDTAATGPDSKAQLNWYRKQFEKLGVELVIRGTDYNRFQEKVRNAKVQLFSWGWNADYPDPENFLFLLAGENAPINNQGTGVNAANYDNPEYNQLFKQMKSLENGEERQVIIEKMLQILRADAPWAWGLHPKSLVLYHGWYQNVWANPLANNTLKYKKLDEALRFKQQQTWNQPVVWPLWLLLLGAVLISYPLVRGYRARQRAVIQTEVNR